MNRKEIKQAIDKQITMQKVHSDDIKDIITNYDEVKERFSEYL